MPKKPTKKEELTASHKSLSDEDNQQTETLHSNEARFRTLIDSLPFGVFLIGRDGRYVLQNTSCRDNWGDIIGKRPDDVCRDKETLALWKSNNSRAFGGETVEGEVSFKVEGEEKHYYNIISPVREKKEITGVLGINIDFTERHRVERRFRSLVEQTSDAVFCYKYTPPIATSLPIVEQVKRLYDGILVECNDVCAQSYGARTASEVIGRPLLELFRAEPGSLDGLFEKMIRSGYRTTDEEGVQVLADGTKRYYLNNGHGVVEDGQLVRVWGTFRDITVRKEAEEALRRLNDELEQRVVERTAEAQRFRLAFQNARYAVFWADPETGLLLECNNAAERLLEKGRDEILGKHQSTLHPPQEKERYLDMFGEHVSHGGTEGDEAFIVTRSGKWVPVLISSSLVSVGDTTVIQGIFTDITERKKAEEELSLNSEMFKNVAEGIYLIGKDDSIIKWANARFEKMFGYEPGEMIGRDVSIVNAPTDKTPEETKKEIVDVLEEIGEWHGEVRNIKKDGTPFWCYANVSVFDHPEYGKVHVSVHTDITKRKRIEEELQINEKRLSLIYESVAEILFYIKVEPDDCFRFISVNPAFLKATDMTEDQIVGKFIEEVIPENSIHLVLDNYRKSIKENKIVRWEETSVYPTGEKTGIVSIAPVWDENGICTHLVGSVHDITERKQAQTRLEESERKYRELVEDINDVIYSVDTKGIVVYVSPAIKSLIGYEPHEVIGRHFSDFVHSDDLEAMKKGFESALTDTNVPMDYRVFNKAGSYKWIRVLSKAIKDKKNNVIGIRGVVSDITERKQAEDQMNQLRSELVHTARTSTMGEMTAALAHELNHPLGSILNNANAARRYLEQDNPDLDEIRDIINDIISEDRRANEVMQKVRNLMKKTEVGLAPVQINEIIEEVLTLMRSEFLIENVLLSKQLAKNLPQITGERIQLQQVFINLIMNAIDAMKESETKRLHISTAQHDADSIRICISDTGKGFVDEEKTNLFKPFFTTKEEGMGMGLSVTRTIIKSHGGDICAQNNKDAGASFFITLPVFKERSHE